MIQQDFLSSKVIIVLLELDDLDESIIVASLESNCWAVSEIKIDMELLIVSWAVGYYFSLSQVYFHFHLAKILSCHPLLPFLVNGMILSIGGEFCPYGFSLIICLRVFLVFSQCINIKLVIFSTNLS